MISQLRPAEETIRRHRESGVWRDGGPLGDLRRWRDETPDAVALIPYRDGTPARRLTYAEYAHHVERFAGALHELGVRPGDVVAIQLPNLWQINALMLACARLGATIAPVLTTIRARELERILARVGAVVCVTVDSWAGYDHAATLAELAPRLPALRHRVVLGESVRDGEVDFVRHFQETPWERRHPVSLDEATEDPYRAALVLFTSGTSGEPKGILHSFNTVYAGISAIVAEERIGADDVLFIPHAFAFVGGLLYGVTMPLLAGAASVVLDTWSAEVALPLLAETGTTAMFAAPTYFFDLIAAAREGSRTLPALRLAVTGATTIPGRLVTETPGVLGVPMRALWGMTEVTAQTWTRADQPADWGTLSDGRPGPGLEVDLRATGEITREQPARLFVRGAGVCLATMGRDSGELRLLAEQDDGWYDTGDLAIADGAGGIRIIGRVADRISSRGRAMIPVNDVETELLNHPAVGDVAVVGYRADDGYEDPCAVLVARSTPPPTLAELREHLTRRGMTQWYQPTRLELVDALPRNSAGKVRKELLRRWLNGEAELPTG
ncbi:AMP-binding protein [Micromonospora musae]|uniref:AMP-binding protein n=1 Tax=Micromonospora musae TaxID=1894970 RepID=UPI00341C0C83